MSEAAVIASMMCLENEVEEHYAAMIEKLENSFEDYLESREPHLDRRKELVTGADEPTADELEGFEDASASTETTASAKSSTGIPFFWLTVLSAHDLVAEQISARDREALQYLQDVRWTRGTYGYFLEFFFDENPFFYNKVLRRGFMVIQDEDTGLIHDFREEFTMMDWKEGKNLTVRKVHKKDKSKKKKKGDKKAVEAADEEEEVKYKACKSFFRFFAGVRARREDQGQAPQEEQEEEEEDAQAEEGEEEEVNEHGLTKKEIIKKERDLAIIAAMKDYVLPQAGHLYMEGMQQDQGIQGASDHEDDDDDFTLVSGQPTSLDALPVTARKAVHAVMAVQKKMDSLMESLKAQEKEETREAYRFALGQYAKRRALLMPDEEDEDEESPVPRFWLRALKSLDSAVPYLRRKDERILQHLADVRWVREVDDIVPGAKRLTVTIEWEFMPNEYFKGTLLKKRYDLVDAEEPTDLPQLLSAEADPVEWEEGRDPTVREGPSGRPQPAGSFFCLFKKGATRHAFNLVGEGKEVEEEALEREAELINDIRRALVPDAAQLCTQVEDEDPDEEDSDEDEEDEDAEGSDEEDEAAAAKRASIAANKKAGGGMSRGSWLLLLLVGLMIAGQVFLLIEQLSSGGK